LTIQVRGRPHASAEWTSELPGKRTKPVVRAGVATVIKVKSLVGIDEPSAYPDR